MSKASAVAALLFFAALTLSAQETSNVTAACAKAGVNASEAIKTSAQSGATKGAVEAAKSSCDHGKTDADYAALMQVTMLQQVKEHGTLPATCVNPIEDALRKGAVLNEVPEACVAGVGG